MSAKHNQAHASLVAWYADHGRKDLPWRTTRDPYAIWVSEIMLQQTQVKTVLARYYHPFLDAFPTVQALAQAPEEAVLKAWEGLGYYRRARHLHQAAKQCVTKHQGEVPRNVEHLLALPGIGQNTAHAIACFAYKAAVPVMEANVKRVLCRLEALENPSTKTLWQKAERWLHHADPFTHNQAMMDIGATRCLPKNPQCDQCPLSTACQGKAEPERYPSPKKRRKPPVRKRHILILQREDGALWVQPRTTRFLGGLFGFIEYEAKKSLPPGTQALGHITHHYSHFTLEGVAHLLRVPHPDAPTHIEGKNPTGTWSTPTELASLPLSGADHKILALLGR